MWGQRPERKSVCPLDDIRDGVAPTGLKADSFRDGCLALKAPLLITERRLRQRP